ncbi:PLCD4 phosphodiesterase, partial [Amia calva]|nr:PLCD4 phosphodiesterase [Amia calva]
MTQQQMASSRCSLRIQGDDNLQSMLVGTVMRKIKSRTWKKQRYFKLQEDCMTIWYKSKKTGNNHSTFSVSDVEAVREGHESEVLQSIADEFPPDRCFTLVFRGRRGNLDLVADSAEEAQSWIKGMRKLIENLENMGQREKLDQWICDWFQKADKNRDGCMNFKEVRDLLKMMNVDMNEHHALRLFHIVDEENPWTGPLSPSCLPLFALCLLSLVSEYPVILSIENHCNVEQQRVMAQHLNEILGDKLLKTILDGTIPNRLPSPEELKGKVLLKGKKMGSLEESVNGVAEEHFTGEVSDEDEAADIDEDHLRNDTLRRKGKKSKQRLSKELSDCVVYCKSVHFSSFKHSRAHSKFYEISSFTESKARKHIRDAGVDFVQHNSRQLTRVYPSGLRTDSSNFNPQEMWNVGCQIVALNFQTAGVEMDLNDGLFSQNGRCGYILKPTFMRSSEERFDPENPHDRDGYRPLRLSIQVQSGQQLPKVNMKEGSIVDPLVRVEIHGAPLDQAKQETKYIDNNGFNPVWNETLQFRVHVPELALVRFVVEDYDKTSKNDFVGQYTLPFMCIQQGYRHIHLLSKDGTSIPPSSLFVHIRITDIA